MAGSNRPGGMDSLSMNYPKPTQKSKPLKNDNAALRKAMGGKVDSGQRNPPRIPPISGKNT